MPGTRGAAGATPLGREPLGGARRARGSPRIPEHRCFDAGIDGLLDYADRQARNVIRKIPDGEYYFCDYMDEDSADGYPARLALNLTVDGDEMIFWIEKGGA